MELMNQFVTADINKTAAIVVKLSENIFGSGSTVWMGRFYNSSEFALFRKLKKGKILFELYTLTGKVILL
jgi:hypothetical protein